MYNFKLKKVEPMSCFKFGIVLGVSLSVVLIILMFFWNIISSVIDSIGPQLFINLFIKGLVQLFFYMLMFAFGTIILGSVSAFAAYIFNFSIMWSEGVKIEIENYVEETASEETKEETKEEENV